MILTRKKRRCIKETIEKGVSTTHIGENLKKRQRGEAQGA
jgi:hypothetical protein